MTPASEVGPTPAEPVLAMKARSTLEEPVTAPEVGPMPEEPTPEELYEEFIEMVTDTNRRLTEVLAQSPVRGGVLGKTRLKVRETKFASVHAVRARAVK